MQNTTITTTATEKLRTVETALVKSGASTDWNSATPDQLWVVWGRGGAYNTRIDIDTATGELVAIGGASASRANTCLAMAGVTDGPTFNRLLAGIQAAKAAAKVAAKA